MRPRSVIAQDLGDDILLIFTNRRYQPTPPRTPDTRWNARVALRRMAVDRDLPHRTACQQIATIYKEWQQSPNPLARPGRRL